MAIARIALIQLVEWFPRAQQRRLETHHRRLEAAARDDRAIDSQPSEHRRPTCQIAHRTLMPDMRQCEPWRQAALLDASQRDASEIERLSR